MTPLKSTMIHALELLIILCLSFLIIKNFNINSDGIEIIMSVVLGGFVKFARAHNVIPIKDYVNKK